MPSLTSRPVRAAAAAVVDVAVLVVYLVLLSAAAASPSSARAVVVVGYLALLCVLSLSGAVLSARTGPAGDVLRAAAVGNIAMGVVALASFGIPLVLTGAVLLAPGAGWAGTSRTRVLALPVVMVLVLVVGIVLTGSP